MTRSTHEREISEATETAAESALAVIDVVHSVHDELELPDGFRAEIMEGQLFIGATPNIKHARIIRSIDVALTAAILEAYECYQVVTGQEPDGDRYVPDLGVWSVDMVDEESEAWLMNTADLLLAVEVTSSGREDRDYAKGGRIRAGGRAGLLPGGPQAPPLHPAHRAGGGQLPDDSAHRLRQAGDDPTRDARRARHRLVNGRPAATAR